jgi:hypothetical protein
MVTALLLQATVTANSPYQLRQDNR